MATSLKFYLAALAAFLTVVTFASYKVTESSAGTDKDPEGANRTLYIPYVDATEEYWFAGERIPVENFDIRERFERELVVNTYYHTSTILSLKKATRFFPVIEPILKEYGIPEDFKYLSVAESNLSNATSPSGAKGFWQFMKGTADDYDLEVNSEVDERFHLEKSTRAACQYLLKYKEKFGSWISTAAAYNMGPSGLAREMDNQQFENYFDLNLNEETARYVFRILAIREVLENPQQFGYDIPEEECYLPLDKYKTVIVDKSIPNLGAFAKEHGISYRMLKVYNPWLISYKLTNSRGKEYEIRIPVNG